MEYVGRVYVYYMWFRETFFCGYGEIWRVMFFVVLLVIVIKIE